jgi:hypothetical protein
VFSKLAAGSNPAEIVVSLKLDPVVVHGLHETYARMSKSLLLSASQREEVERVLGPMRTGADLVRAIGNLIEKVSAEAQRPPAGDDDGEVDLGTVLDPETGQHRKLAREEVEGGLEALRARWRRFARSSTPVSSAASESGAAKGEAESSSDSSPPSTEAGRSSGRPDGGDAQAGGPDKEDAGPR